MVPIILFIIGAYSIYCISDEKNNFENRPLESCGINEVINISQYIFGLTKLKKCIDDHLIIKPYIVIFNHSIKRIYGKSSDPNILIGKNGWQFLSNANDINGQYRGINKYKDFELRKVKMNINYYNSRLRSLGSKLFIIIIPTQQVIYSEFLPNYLSIVNPERRVHQLIKSLNSSTDVVPILYLEKCLKNNKKNGLLFNKTEGHWTELGALYGFECISDFVSRKVSEVSIVNPVEYKITEELTNFPPLDYNQILPKVRNNKLEYDIVSAIENSDKTVYIHNKKYGLQPTNLIIGDSFMENSRQYIADAFHNAQEIHTQQQGLGFKTILEDRPKNILYILTERFLNNVFYDISEIPPEIDLKINNPKISGKFNIDLIKIGSKKIRIAGWMHDADGVEPHRVVVVINNTPIYQSNMNRNRRDLQKKDNLLGFDFDITNLKSEVESVNIVPIYYDGSSEKFQIYP